jgi:hypothetical protein
MGLSILIIGFAISGRTRSNIFTEEYMKQNFGSEHQNATGR